MDMKKLSHQVIAIGQIYRVITDACPQASLPNPEMFPMRTYTMAMLRLQQNRKSNAKIEKMLSALSNEINIEDWEEIFNVAIPLELQGNFYFGYNKGADKTKLAAVRKRKGMTQTELAEASGFTQKDISRWENGEIKPGSDSLKKLSAALMCDIDDII